MFVRILSLFCFLCLLQLGRAQDEEAIPEFKKKKEKEPKEQTDEPRPDFKKRSNENSLFKKENVVLGAGFDLSFSYNMALLGLYPSLGYRVFEPLEIGMNMGYNYFGNFNNYNTHSLFGGPYIKVYPYEGYFFQVESVVAHVMYNDNGFLVLKKTLVAYQADGDIKNELCSYLCLDLRTQRPMTFDDVFNGDTNSLSNKLKAAYVKRYDMPPSNKVSSLQVDKIPVSKNIALVHKGINFSYDHEQLLKPDKEAFGLSEVNIFIPYTELKDLLKPEFKKRIGM